MEPTLTPEQKKQLASWASQRDTILGEIAVKRTEKESLIKEVQSLAASKTEISNDIQKAIGRLEVIELSEESRVKLISIEVVDLNIQKSVLQTEVNSLGKEVVVLKEAKANLHDDVTAITKIHETVFSRVSDIERIIGATVTLNSTNAQEIKNILIEAGIELKKVIDIGKENVEVTNRAIIKIPQIVLDLHKDVLERRHINKHKV